MIIALQRAAATPSEITKQNLYKSIEDLFRIYVEFMAEYYGKREVDMPTPPVVEDVFQFIQRDAPAEVPMLFDFGSLKGMPMDLKLDVGASSYYSEIASIQTLDNLLQMNKISVIQYLERIPDGYIPGRRDLVLELKEQEKRAMQMQAAMSGLPTGGNQQLPGGEGVSEQGVKPDIPTGGGYSALQRKVNETGTTAGMV